MLSIHSTLFCILAHLKRTYKTRVYKDVSCLQLLNWLEEKLPSAGKLPSEFSTIVPPLFSCMEDRSGDVRKKAQVVLPHVMAHVGYDNMCKQCSKLSVSGCGMWLLGGGNAGGINL